MNGPLYDVAVALIGIPIALALQNIAEEIIEKYASTSPEKGILLFLYAVLFFTIYYFAYMPVLRKQLDLFLHDDYRHALPAFALLIISISGLFGLGELFDLSSDVWFFAGVFAVGGLAGTNLHISQSMEEVLEGTHLEIIYHVFLAIVMMIVVLDALF